MLLAADEVERARLGRIAPQQPEALQVGEVRVHGGRRGEPDGGADLAHGRRVAVLREVLVDEREDLALARRELRRGGFGRRTHVRMLDRGADGVKAWRGLDGVCGWLAWCAVHALVAELVDALG